MDHQIRIAGSDLQFACAPGQTLLDAALRAGIELPYSCRKGVCGNCAAPVTAGEVREPVAPDLPPGQHLLCQCQPLGDVTIAPSSWRRADPSARKVLTAKVFRNTLAAPDVSLLQLRLPAGQRARFVAGQSLQVLLPDGSRRSYSMANPPHESDSLQLHVRHVPGGAFTTLVQQLQPGATLQVELPYGSATLDPAASGPLWCVAGGTGFAPIKSLLDDMARKGSTRPVTLLWGGRTAASLYLPAAVERWQRLWPQLRYVPAVEDAADAQAAGCFHGRVDVALRAHAPDSLADAEVYCCGAPPMVAAVRQACAERGLPPARFHSDAFVSGPAA